MQDDRLVAGVVLLRYNAGDAGGDKAPSGAIFISGSKLWFIGDAKAELVSSA